MIVFVVLVKMVWVVGLLVVMCFDRMFVVINKMGFWC